MNKDFDLLAKMLKTKRVEPLPRNAFGGEGDNQHATEEKQWMDPRLGRVVSYRDFINGDESHAPLPRFAGLWKDLNENSDLSGSGKHLLFHPHST